MAQSDRRGTGQHPHKSTEEPWPHTRDNQNEAGRRVGSAHGSASDRSTRGASHAGGTDRERDRGSSQGSDLKQREYRDEKGEIHHHTRTYMEQHKGENRK
jgi:hypothetical protein